MKRTLLVAVVIVVWQWIAGIPFLDVEGELYHGPSIRSAFRVYNACARDCTLSYEGRIEKGKRGIYKVVRGRPESRPAPYPLRSNSTNSSAIR